MTQVFLTEKNSKYQYVAYILKATIKRGNVISFDHKFHQEDLDRLSKIGERLGLKVIIDNATIEFEDATKIDVKKFDINNFMNDEPINFKTNEFMDKLNSEFNIEVC